MRYITLLLILAGCCKKGQCGFELLSCSDVNKCEIVKIYKDSYSCDSDARDFKKVADTKGVVYTCKRQWGQD